MKKTLFMLALALTASAYVAKAQIQRGNVLVGTDLSNFQLSLNKGHAFSMRIDPKAAWFIADNFALGSYLSFSLTTAKSSGTYTTYGLGLLGRKYMSNNAVPAVRHTRMFIEANLGIEGDNNNFSGVKSSTNGLGIGVGPGLAYFITPNIGLEGLLKYQGILGFGTTATTSNLNLALGFQIYLPTRAIRQAINNTQ